MTDLRDQLAPIRLTGNHQLGALLRQLRHTAGYSLGQVAIRARVSRSAVGKREQSDGATVGKLIDHLDALGCDLVVVPRTTHNRRPA